MHVLVKAEPPAVELDRGVDVVHDVADAHCGHEVSFGSRLQPTGEEVVPARNSAGVQGEADAPEFTPESLAVVPEER